jgi:hypothetical protein
VVVAVTQEAGRHLRHHLAQGGCARRCSDCAGPRPPRPATGGSSAANVAGSRIGGGSTPTMEHAEAAEEWTSTWKADLTTCRKLHAALRGAVSTAIPLTTDDEPVDLLELPAAQPDQVPVEPARSSVAMTGIQRHALTQAPQPLTIASGSATAVPSAGPPR